MTANSPGLVLVTGASGYIAGHVVAELLAHGYRVRGTVRDTAATHKTDHLRALAEASGRELEFTAADLSRDEGWEEAVAGCDHVLHVASPLPVRAPKTEAEVVRPAVDGTLRVLSACAATPSVTRVVMTSSIAAIVGGPTHDATVRTEADWSNVDACPVYPKSKTLAERAAWDFMAEVGASAGFDLVTVNPGMVMGPLLNADTNASVELIKKLMDREAPAFPRMGFATVDVRDVAVAHRLALETPAAAGNRYILAGEHAWVADIATVLAEEFNPRGFRVPTGTLPDWVVRVAGIFSPTARAATDFMDGSELVSAAKAQRELGWTMRPFRETVVATAESMIALNMLRHKPAVPA